MRCDTAGATAGRPQSPSNDDAAGGRDTIGQTVVKLMWSSVQILAFAEIEQGCQSLRVLDDMLQAWGSPHARKKPFL